MGGLVIGSTMKEVVLEQNWLAIFINSQCNLDCPTCYLGEKKSKQEMTFDVANRLIDTAHSCDGVAVIGTEPLFDKASVDIINMFAESIKTHIITNGVNLEKFAERIKNVQRIDISLDGGPAFYSRSSSFNSICNGAQKWKSLSGGEVYALNTLSSENINHIDDMLEGGRLIGADGILFSPFVKTLGGGAGATPLSIKEIVEALIPFTNNSWKLMIDPYHAIFEWRDWDLIKDDLKSLPTKNCLLIDFDPGDRVRRIGVDGSERHPFLALHPGIKLSGKKMF